MSYAEAITVGDLLVRSADRHGDTEALVFPDHRATYAELLDSAVRAAQGLLALGVRRGDHVGILMPNCPKFVEVFFGASLLGAVVVPINARFKRRELAYVVENSDIVVLLTSDVIAEHVNYVELLHDSVPGLSSAPDPRRLALDAAPALRSVVLFGTSTAPGMVSENEFYQLASEIDSELVHTARARVRVRDVAAMPYTSGTTAYPKGCLLTHEALVRQWLAGGRRLEVRAGDRFWNPMPMFHLSGIGPLLFTLGVGATFICMTHFEPTAALRQIERERPTHLFPLFPPVVMGLLRHPDYTVDLFRDARVMGHVAPPDTLRLAQSLLPPHTVQVGFFGLTECCGTLVSNSPDETLEQRVLTSGRPIEGIEVRIVDADGKECPPGVRGEIHVRGFSVFEGYYKDPDKTAETFLPDGWIRTGDLGMLDQDGRLSYLGRLKDMLKVGGENVAPSEIESHLSTHPAVQLVAVVGKPDEKYGEVPVAFVELARGHSATAEELIDFCRGQLANWKVPREVRFVTEWPMSATKIKKYVLRERLLHEQRAGARDTSPPRP